MELSAYICPFCGGASHQFPEKYPCPVQEAAQKESQEQLDNFRKAFEQMDSEEYCRFSESVSSEEALECLFWVAHNHYVNGIDKMIEIQKVKQFIRENSSKE